MSEVSDVEQVAILQAKNVEINALKKENERLRKALEEVEELCTSWLGANFGYKELRALKGILKELKDD